MKTKNTTYEWFSKDGIKGIYENKPTIKKYWLAVAAEAFITILLVVLFAVGVFDNRLHNSDNDELLFILLFATFAALGVTFMTTIVTIVSTVTHNAHPIRFFSILSLGSFILFLLVTMLSTYGFTIASSKGGWSGFGFIFPMYAGLWGLLPSAIVSFIIKLGLTLQQSVREKRFSIWEKE